MVYLTFLSVTGLIFQKRFCTIWSYIIPIKIYFIPVILQVASLLAALAHPGHIVIYAPGDSLPCRRDAS
ncbi:hypothetical protein C5472_01490 [Photorhabdus sp. RW14-46]|uniref:Uncharacterized protein n=1 Tax=Photorhabdus laumondii subsp. clarkei TaxID=2029685 RepID=A0A329VEK5_9GAMM|nr:hypothetical protein PluDJC_19715 [Photorhabdus laumondii subsp. laumondii]NHB59883.1 hypothetical protein [Photorhabdus sp. RW14-46]PQQ38450.1 hypothetical protein C6H68_07565 [Photorhabdus luminescens]RAW70948.1 hypothetical protein CKY15_10680 [Photorhabdus sp. S7-51]RAW72073.1 hypothetical protein CKY14_10925 [Photorhabdus sp. S14-60]RAW77546.1 hypothetical protein CKY06_11985 [Photorhabdus sp. S15-56]RAW84458.1 hypothetical protein CKY09_12260 [Photorhabdus sp. S5P8-50]RAW85100.1 hyp